MSRAIVLDNSALMALINRESGADVVASVISSAFISTVTLAEAYSKLSEWQGRGRAAFDEILFVIQDVVPFFEEHARLAGELRMESRALGLSLGDRACLALGIALSAEVYTADRVWLELVLPCRVRLIR